MKEVTEQGAYLQLAQLCARSEHCHHELTEKMRRWDMSDEAQARVMARLVGERYVDDERYARAYCESKILHQHWGRQKVLYQLRLKHLPRAAVDSGMAAVSDEAYFAVLTDVAEKKLRELTSNSPLDNPSGESQGAASHHLRQKLTAFLVTRGFLIGEINQVLTNFFPQ